VTQRGISEIHFEVWLPTASNWNRKFEGTGNGGFSGVLSYSTIASALNRGYATAGSDTGHMPDDLKFGVGHPDKIDDWAYRAVHVMTETSKLIVRDYYGRLPQYSYFTGCSTGGQPQACGQACSYHPTPLPLGPLTPLPLGPVARRLLRTLTHHGHQALDTSAPGVYLIVVYAAWERRATQR
jgi:hypothetical protein